MLVEVFEAGPVATNGYLIADRPGGVAAVVDAPQGVAARMIAQAREWQTPIRFILNTHGHWDHIWDNAALQRLSGAKLGIHRDSAPLLAIQQARYFGLAETMEASRPDFFLAEGAAVELGTLRWEILDCPGHCPGSVTLYERHEQVALVGDVLFAGSIGRTDLPGGDHATLLRSIRTKLLTLPDAVRVLPGHGPATTIGRERRRNPFLA